MEPGAEMPSEGFDSLYYPAEGHYLCPTPRHLLPEFLIQYSHLPRKDGTAPPPPIVRCPRDEAGVGRQAQLFLSSIAKELKFSSSKIHQTGRSVLEQVRRAKEQEVRSLEGQLQRAEQELKAQRHATDELREQHTLLATLKGSRAKKL
ncbi:hypothetical protein CYMTET_33853 [Cymbomonas tetramitiformis]|uniref:Uncharacterized protein n=1 Tax=Cymbomonas tetramitiformis TaxID=36881 RepID=A0AAE0FCW5_9CHLO|nr:hypothetical protein CYMTET_33853 [Cymbomonas tetramitiformis]